MYASELLHFIGKHPKLKSQFGGIYPEDILPFNSNKRFFIINTDPSYEQGSHWVAIHISNFHAEFFDSLAGCPSQYSENIENFLVVNALCYYYNKRKLQSDTSRACGLYCLYYLFWRCEGYSMEEILARFTENFDYNESIVHSFYTYNKHIH